MDVGRTHRLHTTRHEAVRRRLATHASICIRMSGTHVNNAVSGLSVSYVALASRFHFQIDELRHCISALG